MSTTRSAIVAVALDDSAKNLDYTFLSFAQKNPGVPLHAFFIGTKLPEKRFPEVTYHLVPSIPDFSHPLRQVYFRRHELIDQLDAEFTLIVDAYDVLCLQPLPPLEKILAGFDMAAATENLGSRYILGQGYTSSFLNGGVTFWNVPKSRDIRAEILARGRTRFRTVADDQWVINETVHTKYFERVRILPSQYNYRAYFNHPQPPFPTVTHLDGVLIYHNAETMDKVKKLPAPKFCADLPALEMDPEPLSPREQEWRSRLLLQTPHILRESLRFQILHWFLSKKIYYRILRRVWPVMEWLKLDKVILRWLPIG
jgi:hypothetical protein